MALASYKKLTLRWQPGDRADRIFLLIATVCVVVTLLLGVYMSSVKIPEKPRLQRAVVPERIAKFIAQKDKPLPKPKPVAPKPKRPEPKPPEPKPEPEVKVVRDRPKEPDKPLTENQQKARDKAATSGLMAHLAELNDLVDTAEVSAQVQGGIKQTEGGKTAATVNTEILTAGATGGSGGVDASRYATTAGNSELGSAELAAARAALNAGEEAFAKVDQQQTNSKGKARSEEEVTLVFDRQKAKLQNLYNRARRKNPLLKGKLLLEITILPDGSVSKVDVLSSELSDPALVKSLVARIKGFQFGAREVPVATVTYPIEFLPH